MALVIEKPVAAFNLAEVKRGYLFWGKHFTWPEGKAGFITSATDNQLIVQYHPGIGNVTNHFIIPISEAIAGEWVIRWSADMTEVHEYTVRVEEGTEVGNETGRTDI